MQCLCCCGMSQKGNPKWLPLNFECQASITHRIKSTCACVPLCVALLARSGGKRTACPVKVRMRKKNDPDPDEQNIHFKCPRGREVQDPAEVRMAFVPIGGRFMDGSFRHESMESEDRESSLRSPTHDVEATAADAFAHPESEHPKVSVVETFASRWRNADKEYSSDKICTRVWEKHKLLGMFGDGRFAKTYKVRQNSTGMVWLSNSAA